MKTTIHNAQLIGESGLFNIKLNGDRIDAITPSLDTSIGSSDSQIIDAHGGTLLPGLRDHHCHLLSSAAARQSVDLSSTTDVGELIDALCDHNDRPTTKWLRVINYHQALAGDIDREFLDQYCPNAPIRVQHRGGRLWYLNSVALTALKLTPSNAPPGAELKDGRLTGRLYELDDWMSKQLSQLPPSLEEMSEELASKGVTEVTDTTPRNGSAEYAYFANQQFEGRLKQNLRMMGNLSLTEGKIDLIPGARIQLGEYKIHLLESQLPDIEKTEKDIRAARAQGRNVAVHCVTLVELVYILGALELAGGGICGDRIEHGSVIPDEFLESLSAKRLGVVTQPHFVHSRGDQYLNEVERQDQPFLYRLQGLIGANIPLAAGSDAPFGHHDPWLGMRSAINRKTSSGRSLGSSEVLTATQALTLYTGALDRPFGGTLKPTTGDLANLCLLDRPWEDAKHRLLAKDVRATWINGQLAFLR